MAIEPGDEGWYTDPYARHDARWMSQGSPTRLVRDGTVESYDDPPSEPYVHAPEPIEAPGASHGDDLRRADEAEAGEPYDPAEASRAALDAFDETSGA